jgi:hypothetical protein
MAAERCFQKPVSCQPLKVATANFTMCMAVMAKIVSLPGRKVKSSERLTALEVFAFALNVVVRVQVTLTPSYPQL